MIFVVLAACKQYSRDALLESCTLKPPDVSASWCVICYRNAYVSIANRSGSIVFLSKQFSVLKVSRVKFHLIVQNIYLISLAKSSGKCRHIFVSFIPVWITTNANYRLSKVQPYTSRNCWEKEVGGSGYFPDPLTDWNKGNRDLSVKVNT